MSWKLLDKPKTFKVTKKLAESFANMDPAPHDRPLSERRLEVYRRILKEGGFRPVTWASVLCKETGGVYRVNGKHTSVLLSSVTPLPEFYVTVEEYECDTLDDVARLYSTFDSNIQSRTAQDIYLSFAATVGALKDLPARHIGLAVAGMALHGKLMGGDTDLKSRSQAGDRAELLLEHPEFVVWMSGILSNVTKRSAETLGTLGTPGAKGRASHMTRSPVTGAMFGCYGKAQAAATDFWCAVRDETGATPGLPDRKLARYLTTAGVETGGRGMHRLKHAEPREMFVKCVHAWNAWRKNETTSMPYYADKDVPSFK